MSPTELTDVMLDVRDGLVAVRTGGRWTFSSRKPLSTEHAAREMTALADRLFNRARLLAEAAHAIALSEEPK